MPKVFLFSTNFCLKVAIDGKLKNDLATYPFTTLQLYLHFHNVILLEGRMTLADCKESKTMYGH